MLIWVELDGGVCYELGDDSFLLNRPVEVLKSNILSILGFSRLPELMQYVQYAV